MFFRTPSVSAHLCEFLSRKSFFGLPVPSTRTRKGSLPVLVLTLGLIFAWPAAPRVHAQTAVAPTVGDGLTTATAFQITEIGNLVWLGDRAAANETAGKYYQLMNDLDASDTATWNDAGTTTDTYEGFQPISFRGTFNGDGKRIIGLTINRLEMDNVGLFSNINAEGRVLNLTLENSTVRGRAYVGNLVGHLYDGQVKDCSATGSVIGRSRIGGLVGNNASGTVANCSAAGSATGDSFVGGLVGDNYDSGRIVNSSATGTVVGDSYVGGLAGENNTSCIIDRCVSTGSVTANSNLGGLVGLNNSAKISNSFATGAATGGWNVGGLVGIDSSGTIENCFATGQVIDGDNVGGLVGNSSSKKIANCFATGTVSGMENVGGLVGNNRGTIDDCFAIGAVTGRNALGGLVGVNTGTVTHSYWDVETTGQGVSAGSDAGYGKITAQMKDVSTFGNFSSVWGIVEGVSYPYLQFAPPPFRLDVTFQGPGAVTPAPPSGPYAAGTSLTLTATPAGADTVFLGWMGLVAQPTSQSTALLMDTHKSVTARFRAHYEIRTLAELQAIATGDLRGHYILMNDIEASDTVNWNDAGTDAGAREGFRPIGTVANPSATSFQGIFDGNGKRIIGLTINRPGENGVGLFGCIGASGSVRHLILEGGGVAGQEYVGNLAGRVRGGRVEGCAATGSITGLKLTGGLVGYNSGGTIENCFATGEVTGNLSVGGLIGGNSQSFVRNSFATGAVTGSSYVGGLVGSSPQSTVTACYWDRETTGQVVSAGSDAGFGKTTSEMKKMATFAGWDFASIWGIVENQSYPYLRFSPPPFHLTVSIAGPGSVTLLPVGGVYVPGTTVTLTATPAAGARFAGWTGAGTSETVLSISLLVDAPKGVTAHFRRNYEIRTLAELQAIATAGDFDGYYTLMNDLDASDTANWNDAGTTDTLREGFRPIGMASSAPPSCFRGVFDGNGKKITGLTINRPGASHAGLFALLGRGGEIRNLTLENVRVTGETNVGALVAYNSEGTVVNCSASGPVTGQFYTGGLVGYNYYGALVDCVTAGLVTGGSYMDPFTGGSCAGGLLGYNYYGSIENGVTSGQVLGDGPIGGLVGVNEYGTIATSYATGAVAETDGKNYWIAGGLVGYNKYGTVVQSFATGSVTGAVKYGSGSGFEYNRLGGLIGYNYGTVKDCFATGAVTETATSQPYLGGLIGLDYSSQEVTHCFATGRVLTLNKNNSFAGGLIGIGGRLKACYWDVETTGRTTSSGGTGGVGKTTAEMKHQATFQPGGGTGASDWDFTSVWGIVEGQSYPYLRFAPVPFHLNVAIEGEGTVVTNPPGGSYASGTTVTLTATAAAGFCFDRWLGAVTNPMTTSTALLMDSHKSVTAHFEPEVYSLVVVPNHGSVAKSPDQATYSYGTTVTLTATPDAHCRFTGWDGPVADPGTATTTVFITDDTSVTARFELETYALAVVANHGSVVKSPDQATYPYGTTVTLTATPDAGYRFVGWTGPVADWTTSSTTLVMTGDTTVTARFGRVYEIRTLAELQAVATGDLEGFYLLMNDIDASATATWNDAGTDTSVLEGFRPIGAYSDAIPDTTSFRGVFEGNGKKITGLTINRPYTYYVGLFGVIGTGGRVKDLTLEGGTVQGYNWVGGVVAKNGGRVTRVATRISVIGKMRPLGLSPIPTPSSLNVGGLAGGNTGGTLTECTATGPVTGEAESVPCYAGGLVGYNSGTINQSFASGRVMGKGVVTFIGDYGDLFYANMANRSAAATAAAVTGKTSVGGLVGNNDQGTLAECFATGIVVGEITPLLQGYPYVGGLVGSNGGGTLIENCFATGRVTCVGQTCGGGLVGYGSVVDACYWDMETSGQNTSAGGAVGKTTTEMKQKSTFQPGGGIDATDWDFTSVWGIVEGQTYPYLRALSSEPLQFHLDVSVTGAGSGTVTMDPPGGVYAPGTVVTLTATVEPGSHFADWAGPVADPEAVSTTIVLDTHKTVTARFLRHYEIRTLSELQAMNTGDPEGYYRLMNDIDASVTATWNDPDTTTKTLEGFWPIGASVSDDIYDTSTPSYPGDPTPLPPDPFSFEGVFDGNGKKIVGLTINHPEKRYVGLFRSIGVGGIVKDLTLEGGTVGGGDACGGVAGRNMGALIRCVTSGSVIGLKMDVFSHPSTGGLVGENQGLIRSCFVTGPVTADAASYYIGGLAALNSGTIEKSFATGSVTRSNPTLPGVAYPTGGLVAKNASGVIANCFATGAVTGGSPVGGLVGINAGGTLKNAYAIGQVTGSGLVGGLLGRLESGTVTACYWDVETTGQATSAGGVGAIRKTTAEMKQKVTFQPGGGTGATDWDFTSVWGIVEGKSYPFLRTATAPPLFRLDVSVTGQGSVTLDPPGALYVPGTVVTLTATANTGSHLLEWIGPVTDPNTPVTSIVLDTPKSVTARFLPSHEIRTLEELQALTSAVPGEYYILMNDLDASATANWNDAGTSETDLREGFRPIGTYSNPDTTSFRAIFNGNGKKITGLTINRPDRADIGLFGVLGKGGEIRNLRLEQGRVVGDTRVGGLVGTNAGGTVSNCSADVQVKGGLDVGGLVGSNRGKLTHCSATGLITGNLNAGGLAGEQMTGIISDCFATASVMAEGDSGGLIGADGGDKGIVKNSFATGDVIGTGQYLSSNNSFGGLIGYTISDGKIENCYATGNVTGLGQKGQTLYMGGLIGNNGGAHLTNCFATGSITCEKGESVVVGGLVGYVALTKISKCFASGRITCGNTKWPSLGGLVGNGEGIITACYWDKETTGQTSSPGSDASFGKTTAEMKQKATFQPGGGTGATDWDFAAVWGIFEGQTYPFLRTVAPLCRLTVAVEGAGSVTQNPVGEFFRSGSEITLTARPGAGSRFVRWTGDVPVGSAGQNPLKFSIRGNASLKVGFEAGSHPAVWMVR